jgi:hypothetical protein
MGLKPKTISPPINADLKGGQNKSKNRANVYARLPGSVRRAFCCQIEEFTDDFDRPIVAFRSYESTH